VVEEAAVAVEVVVVAEEAEIAADEVAAWAEAVVLPKVALQELVIGSVRTRAVVTTTFHGEVNVICVKLRSQMMTVKWVVPLQWVAVSADEVVQEVAGLEEAVAHVEAEVVQEAAAWVDAVVEAEWVVTEAAVEECVAWIGDEVVAVPTEEGADQIDRNPIRIFST